MERKTKIKFMDFECNLIINGMNEFRNMLLAEDLPTEDIDKLLLKTGKDEFYYKKQYKYSI